MHSVLRRLPPLALLAAGTLAACDSESTSPEASPPPAFATTATGNGAPSGAHYNLNIIGVPKAKSGDLSGGGNVIFVNLGNKGTSTTVTSKILLEQSASVGVFAVLDKDGTDGEAKFSLPAPGTYSIWARALGTPGGSSTVTTCATDITDAPADGDICSTLNEVFVRGTGKSSFRNVTTNLTTINLDPLLDADAVTACGGTTVSLFDGCLEGYFWQYDNTGLKLLQLRFYSTAS